MNPPGLLLLGSHPPPIRSPSPADPRFPPGPRAAVVAAPCSPRIAAATSRHSLPVPRQGPTQPPPPRPTRRTSRQPSEGERHLKAVALGREGEGRASGSARAGGAGKGRASGARRQELNASRTLRRQGTPHLKTPSVVHASRSGAKHTSFTAKTAFFGALVTQQAEA
ncbi:hypothetical protein EJB05_52889, partial [Eragrostis curvula]